MATAARPSSARATLRGRGPGSNHCQPQPHPGPGSDEHRRELEQAVRGDQPEEDVTPPVGHHQAADDPDVDRVLGQHVDGWQHEQ
jgi:hypothetical protein